MIEQYKVNALRDALQSLIKDRVSYCDDAGEVMLDLKDSDIKQLVANLDWIIGKEYKV